MVDKATEALALCKKIIVAKDCEDVAKSGFLQFNGRCYGARQYDCR